MTNDTAALSRAATKAQGHPIAVTLCVKRQEGEEQEDNLLILDVTVFSGLQDAQRPLNEAGIETRVVVPTYRAPRQTQGSTESTTPLQATLSITPQGSEPNACAQQAIEAALAHLGAVGIMAFQAACHDVTLADLRETISRNIKYYLEYTRAGNKREAPIRRNALNAMIWQAEHPRRMPANTFIDICNGRLAPYRSGTIHEYLRQFADALGVTVDDLKHDKI